MMHEFGCCLWVDGRTQEIADYYLDIFEASWQNRVDYVVDDTHQKIGDILTIELELAGCEFLLLNGGPEFKPTPAVSYVVYCESGEQLVQVWRKLSTGGKILQPLAEDAVFGYTGKTIDPYGFSWQVCLADRPQRIVPHLLFAGTLYGKAKEAIALWTDAFGGALQFSIPDKKGKLQLAGFTLRDQEFLISEQPDSLPFSFSMANSFYLYCKDQADIDQVWAAITADGTEYDCGWMNDRYDLSWQTTTRDLADLFAGPDLEQARQVTLALYEMKRLDIEKLRQVYDAAAH